MNVEKLFNYSPIIHTQALPYTLREKGSLMVLQKDQRFYLEPSAI